MSEQQKQPQSGAQFSAVVRRAQQQARIASSHIGLPAHPSNALPRSGVQPDASGQVLCPYCHKHFPFSPVLLNRHLRCSGCRSTFRVAEDRRTFRVQAAEGAPAPETRTITKAAHQAIKQANVSLNEAAAAALRALGRQDRPAPPGSESALVAAVAKSPGDPPTRSIRRKGREAALTGEGVEAGRRHHLLLATAAALLVVAALFTWLARPDARTTALRDFQHGLSFASLARAQRDNALSAGIVPVQEVAGASFGPVIRIELSALEEAMRGMRILRRGQVMVERARFGEATSLLGDADLSEPRTLAQFSERCRKAGIRMLTWSELLAIADKGQSGDAAGILRALLLQPEAGEGVLDAVARLDAVGLPKGISVCRFSGSDGTLLMSSGPARHPVPYNGRLLRLHGDGWPDTWQVFDLRAGDLAR